VTYIPPPKNLLAFPEAKRAKSKTPIAGGGLRKRWKDKDYIYEWDSYHGRVEKYDKRGNHLGEFDPNTGEQTKPADSNRQIEP
jgi:hypothetical protein